MIKNSASKKALLSVIILTTVFLAFLVILSGCEIYTPGGSKILDFRGDVPEIQNTTAFENFEVAQGVAIRDGYVAIMIVKNIDEFKDGEYIGITGGITDKVPGGETESASLMEAILGEEEAATIPSNGWSATPKNSLHLQEIGLYKGEEIWAMIIPRENLYPIDETTDFIDKYFSWKFVYGEEWTQATGGQPPFLNGNDFNNGCGRLNRIPVPTGVGQNTNEDADDYFEKHTFYGGTWDAGGRYFTKEDYKASGAFDELGTY
jgi:hypothetical protein